MANPFRSILNFFKGRIKTANSNPIRFVQVEAKDGQFYANSHPYKVVVEGGGGDVKLYDGLGNNTDGAMTQKASTEAFNGKQNKLTPGDNISIDAETNEISATDTTYNDFIGATSSTDGASGLVPAPTTADMNKFLRADGSWGEISGGDSVKTIKVSEHLTSGALVLSEVVDDAGYYVIVNDTNNAVAIKNTPSMSNINQYYGYIWGNTAYPMLVRKAYYSSTIDGYHISIWVMGSDSVSVQLQYPAEIKTYYRKNKNTGNTQDALAAFQINRELVSGIINTSFNQWYYTGAVFSAAAARTQVGIMRGYTSPTTSTNISGVAPWTNIGTGSSYTKRAFNNTLEISETGVSVSANTWTTIGITLPNDFRPSIVVVGTVNATGASGIISGRVRVKTDGVVEVYFAESVSDVYGSITFPGAN